MTMWVGSVRWGSGWCWSPLSGRSWPPASWPTGGASTSTATTGRQRGPPGVWSSSVTASVSTSGYTRRSPRYSVPGHPLHTVTVCRVLAAKDYLVFGHDHIGHGESDGKRAYIENVDHYVDDIIHHSMELKVSSLLQTLDWLSGQEKYKELPIYIIGHSMGGMIALRSVLRHPGYFSGMILNGPLVIPGPQVTRRGRVGGLLILLSVDWSNWPEVHSNPYICIEDRVTASQLDHTRGPWRETKFKVAILNFLGPTGQTKPQSNHKVIPRHSESLKVWF